jgi:hypothetical protein
MILRRHVLGSALCGGTVLQAFDNTAMKDTSFVLYDMARELIAQRKAQPLPQDEDPVSALLAVRLAGDEGGGPEVPLPDEMIVGTVRQVLVVASWRRW